jgi:hypothetical protein
LLGVTTGLELGLPGLKQITPELKYRLVSIVLGCAFVLLAPLILCMPFMRYTRYGIEITSPQKLGSPTRHSKGELQIVGKYKRRPPEKSLYLINASPDKKGFCPQVEDHQQIVFDEKNKVWRGSTYIKEDTHIIAATVSPGTRALFNYYKKVGQTQKWMEIDELPRPPDCKNQDEVFVRCN